MNQERIDPRVIRTRTLLRESLYDLIVEKGYNNITVKDITDRATLNRATFYLHYRDKDDLLYQGMREVLDELVQSVMADESRSSDRTRALIMRDFEHFGEHAEYYRVMLGEDGFWGFIHALQNYFFEVTWNRHKARFALQPEPVVDIQLVFRYMAVAYVGVIQWWLENEMPYTPAEIADMLIYMYRQGMIRAMGFPVKPDHQLGRPAAEIDLEPNSS